MSIASGPMVYVAALLFAVGVMYFWPTMLGVVSERVPRSGALGLGLMGTVGMATVGLVTAPQMGSIADRYAHAELPVPATVALFERADGVLSGRDDPDAVAAAGAVDEVLAAWATSDVLPAPETANGLRAIIASDVDEEVLSVAAVEIVIASRQRLSRDWIDLIRCFTVQGVVAAVAVDRVVAGLAFEQVGVVVADQLVGVARADDEVGAALRDELFIARFLARIELFFLHARGRMLVHQRLELFPDGGRARNLSKAGFHLRRAC